MDYAETYDGCSAKGILQIDAEIVKKSHFRMETDSFASQNALQKSIDEENFSAGRLLFPIKLAQGVQDGIIRSSVPISLPLLELNG